MGGEFAALLTFQIPHSLRSLRLALSRGVVLAVLVLLTCGVAPAAAEAATERAQIAWDTATDIDLHAFDEAGNRSYYATPGAIPNSTLSSDNTVGFGPENFTDNEDPGTARTFRFEVCYYEDSPDGGPTTVSGTITDGDLSSRPVSVTLSAPGICAELGVSHGRPPIACADGTDNDGDGLADASDPGCASAEDNDEQDYADLEVQTQGQDDVSANDIITTTTTVTNAGPAPASTVVLDELIEGEGKVVSASSDRGPCTSGEAISCEVGDLPVGGSATVTVRTEAGVIEPEGEEEERQEGSAAAAGARSSARRVTPGGGSQVSRRSGARSRTPDPNGTNNGASGRTTVAGCTASLKVGVVRVRAGCLRKSGGVWRANRHISVNGLNIDTSGTFAINPKKLRLSASGDVTVSASRLVLYRGRLTMELAGSFKLEAAAGAKLKRFPIQGKIKGKFANGKITFDVFVGMPSAFGGVTVDAGFYVADRTGLVLSSLDINAKKLTVKRLLTIRDFKLSYKSANDEWSGGLKVEMPGPMAPKVKGGASFVGGSFRLLTVDVSGVNRPLAAGIFLQAVGFTIGRGESSTLAGRMQLSAGPKVRGKTAVGVKGQLRYSPGLYRLTGNITLVSAKLSSAYLEYRTPSRIALGGRLDWTIRGYGFKARTTGWVDGKRAFNLEGNGRIAGPGPDVSGNGLISNRGIGACGRGFAGIKLGFRYRWGAPLPTPGCDLGPIRATASGRASQAGVHSVKLPQGLPQAMLAVEGAGAAPAIRVTSPDGQSVDVTVSGDDAVTTSRLLAFRRDDDATTYVFLGRPRAGRWTVQALPGSAAITRVASAHGLPDPRVVASVRRAGRTARLSWTLRAIPGQSVQFVEEASNVRRVITTTNRARGTKRFRPAPGVRRRQIVAYVEQDGVPRKRIPLRRFSRR